MAVSSLQGAYSAHTTPTQFYDSPWRRLDELLTSYEKRNERERQYVEALEAGVSLANLRESKGSSPCYYGLPFPDKEVDEIIADPHFADIPFEWVEKILLKAQENHTDLILALAESSACQNAPTETLLEISKSSCRSPDYFLAATGRFPEFPKISKQVRLAEKAMIEGHMDRFLHSIDDFSSQDVDAFTRLLEGGSDAYVKAFIQHGVFQQVSQNFLFLFMEESLLHGDSHEEIQIILSHPKFSPDPALLEKWLPWSTHYPNNFFALMNCEQVQQLPSEAFGRTLLEIVEEPIFFEERASKLISHPDLLPRVSQPDFAKGFEAYLSQRFPAETNTLSKRKKFIRDLLNKIEMIQFVKSTNQQREVLEKFLADNEPPPSLKILMNAPQWKVWWEETKNKDECCTIL